MSERMDEKSRWNGPGGNAWIDNRDFLDTMFSGFEAVLTEAVQPGEAVLDVGCGTGATTRALARALGSAGNATGIDISEPMIEVARNVTAHEGLDATFIAADGQLHPFPAESYDRLVSRFGVMFFADPVQAFANLRRATRPEGELLFVAWRSRDDNPFMTVADRAAAPLLPTPQARPSPSGQFGFADADYVQGILAGSVWRDGTIEALDVDCAFPTADLPRYAARMGPLAPVLKEMDEPSRDRIVAAILEGYAPYVSGDVVRYTAACWAIRARA